MDDLNKAIADARARAYSMEGEKGEIQRQLVERLETMIQRLESADVPDEALLREQLENALRGLAGEVVEDTIAAARSGVSAMEKAHVRGYNALAAAQGTESFTTSRAYRTGDLSPDRWVRELEIEGLRTIRGVGRIDAIVESNVRFFGQETAAPIIEEAVEQAGERAAEEARGAIVDRLRQMMEDGTGLFHRLRTTAVNETLGYIDAADKQLAAWNPAVDLVKWELSGRHDGLASSPDACDVLASQDLYDYGAGLYHPETVPSRPHPNCECTTSYRTRPVSEWGRNRPVRDLPESIRSYEPTRETARDVEDLQPFERELYEQMQDIPGNRTVTPAHARHQARMIYEQATVAHANPR